MDVVRTPVQYQAYQLEVSDRGRSARASLKSGDLNAALDAVEDSIATAEQNPHWADMAPVKQLFSLATILHHCTRVSDLSAEGYERIGELNSRVELLLHGRMMRKRPVGLRR
jgi:hypothetical protein